MINVDRMDALIHAYLKQKDSDPDGADETLGSILQELSPLTAKIADDYLGRSERDDAAQEVALHIERILPRYSGNKGELRAWLSRVITNRVISLRRYSRTHGGPQTVPLDDDDDIAAPEAETGNPFNEAVQLWIVTRFPSLPALGLKGPIDSFVGTLVTLISEKRSIKTASRVIRQHVRKMSAPQSVQLYDAVLVFLRLLAFTKPSDWSGVEMEFSLTPELRLLMGDQLFGIFYTLFRETHITFPTRGTTDAQQPVHHIDAASAETGADHRVLGTRRLPKRDRVGKPAS